MVTQTLYFIYFQIGKSFFVVDLLVNQEKIFDRKFDKVIWAYGIKQDSFFQQMQKKISNLEFIHGFPENELLNDTLVSEDQNLCLVIGMLQIQYHSMTISVFTQRLYIF